MNSGRIQADSRTSGIWRTARRRRAAYLATRIHEPAVATGHDMIRKSVIPGLLASAMSALALWRERHPGPSAKLH